MSFGRPGGLSTFSVAPPDRGSFPLDHDGDCKEAMMGYLKCLKLNGSNNGECRLEAKNYLGCRMDHNLMTRDDFSNLGLGDVGQDHHASLRPSPSTTGMPPTGTSTSPSTSSANTPHSNTTINPTTTTTPRI